MFFKDLALARVAIKTFFCTVVLAQESSEEVDVERDCSEGVGPPRIESTFSLRLDSEFCLRISLV